MVLLTESDKRDIVEDVIEDNPDAVDDYKRGIQGSLNFLVGQAVGESNGQINPAFARREIQKRLPGP